MKEILACVRCEREGCTPLPSVKLVREGVLWCPRHGEMDEGDFCTDAFAKVVEDVEARSLKAGFNLAQDWADGPVVCVVRFVDTHGPVPANPAVLFQVTVDRANCSRGGLIRFGGTAGDELSGWMRRAQLEVVEVLGDLQADGRTVVVRAAA